MKKRQLETFVYGLLSLVFGMAFFFGVLYPDYGVSKSACRITEKDISQSYRYMELEDVDMDDLINQYGPVHVQYKSYFYECMNNSQ